DGDVVEQVAEARVGRDLKLVAASAIGRAPAERRLVEEDLPSGRRDQRRRDRLLLEVGRGRAQRVALGEAAVEALRRQDGPVVRGGLVRVGAYGARGAGRVGGDVGEAVV